ncbi:MULTISPECIES: YedE family putative selenium transporter [unclassified Pseudodesulfovibrio]|uniref:YedE family putative selenium transporter n=1 Tax=unclassified Pseudodesulfovibrio TaxID=2661612 RepID=UPI000FEB985C|nr:MULTISPECIES: YedE family putative selenium transporter [unclassified Pseudodesulfovibrio]MCJ2163619.1 YedE family putative selenium transporter [Pseudodesulfovibrio sp. S3-i]RWU06849.1 YedE-related selenium metabolism membrane protein [Pseudodesulfovibrio sp. S3]
MSNFFATRKGIISVGLVIGGLAALLQYLGNPGNMGICVACFERDIAGAVGLHRAGVVQYMRPEIIGFVLGALGAAFVGKDFRPRAGSAPIVRFILGAFAMIGALVFLGCPWRAVLRLAGGDLNSLFGLAGLIVGIGVGTMFFRQGYNLGRSQKTYWSVGLLMPLLMVGFLVLMFLYPQVADQPKTDVLFYSLKGPGAMHAPLLISLGVGLLVGVLAQRSRFCTMGAFRDLILFKQVHLLSGVVALLVAAFALNLVLGQFNLGFDGQPVAHTQGLWNFMGMLLAGLCFALAGGCPGRQLFLAGEGDGDAAVFVLGMIVGAGFAHNFGLASSPKGVGPHGIAAVFIGLAVCLFIGFTMRKKAA